MQCMLTDTQSARQALPPSMYIGNIGSERQVGVQPAPPCTPNRSRHALFGGLHPLISDPGPHAAVIMSMDVQSTLEHTDQLEECAGHTHVVQRHAPACAGEASATDSLLPQHQAAESFPTEHTQKIPAGF